MDQWGGKDIYQIGSMYASSPAWAGHVEYYMNKIQDFALSNPKIPFRFLCKSCIIVLSI